MKTIENINNLTTPIFINALHEDLFLRIYVIEAETPYRSVKARTQHLGNVAI